MAGVALGDIHLRFVRQAWRLWHWAGSGGALGHRWLPGAAHPLCVAGVALGDINFVLLGMRGTYGTGLFTLHGRRGTRRH